MTDVLDRIKKLREEAKKEAAAKADSLLEEVLGILEKNKNLLPEVSRVEISANECNLSLILDYGPDLKPIPLVIPVVPCEFRDIEIWYVLEKAVQGELDPEAMRLTFYLP